MKKIYFLVMALYCITADALAQSPPYNPLLDIPKVVPPSPNAATLGKYGEIPLGLYTGTPKINIPFYEVKLGALSLPISISYHSQGLKVEEKSGYIGLNWALNCGGVITRSVRGKPDENSLGYWGQSNLTNEQIAASGPTTGAFCGGTLDAQPDMFYFNFGNNSGKFVIDGTPQHLAHIIPDQGSIRIEHTGTLSSFILTDDQGIKYIFDAKETTTDDNSPPTILNYTSAWYLSKIITPTGNITFTYATEGTSYSQYYEIDHLNAGPDDNAIQFNPGPRSGRNIIDISTKVLSSITTPYETIEFTTVADRKDIPTSKRITGFTIKDDLGIIKKKVVFNQSYFGNAVPPSPDDCRLKLDEAVEYSSDSTLSKKYSFTYNTPTSVPSILSLSQDYWGYYNGKTNNSLLPYMDPRIYGTFISNQASKRGDREPDVSFAQTGCLSKITFPTGGTTEFVYESNDYSNVNGVAVNEPHFTAKTARADAWRNSTQNNPIQTKPFTINNEQDVIITTSGNYSGPTPPENGPTVYVNKVNSDGSRTNILTRYMIKTTNIQVTNLEIGNYEVIATVDGLGQTVTGSVSHYWNDGYAIRKKYAGGIRIRRMINTDPQTAASTIKEYSYTDAVDSLSSGVLTSEINLVSSKKSESLGYEWVTRSASTSNYLGTTQGSFIGYGMVTEKEGTLDQGKKVSYFTTADSFPNSLGQIKRINNLNSLVGTSNTKITSRYLNDNDAYRGYLIKENYYNASEKLIKDIAIQYSFTTNPPSQTNYFALKSKAGFLFNMCAINCSNCLCLGGGGCVDCLPYNIIMYYISDTEIICPWIYKTQVLETLYDDAGLNPMAVTTNFFYDNPIHRQLTRTELINSEGKISKTVNKYPQDKNQISGLSAVASLAIDSLVKKNRITTIVESEEYTNGVFNSRLRTNFKVWSPAIVSPENVQFQTQSAVGLENRIQFTGYDINGNVLENSKIEGMPTAYLWGYKKKYPIAEVLNAKSNTIFFEGFEEGAGNTIYDNSRTGHYSFSGTYNKTLSGLNNGTYTLSYWSKTGSIWAPITVDNIPVTAGSYAIALTGQIDDVRFYPYGAQMTTYTYQPLVGMTSSTDSKGQTTYYEYDGLLRLKTVKDQNLHIVKSYEYHYKP